MKTFTLLALVLAVNAKPDDIMCDVCDQVVTSFDKLDPSELADAICPYIGFETICEDVVPSIVKWAQREVVPDKACAEFCTGI